VIASSRANACWEDVASSTDHEQEAANKATKTRELMEIATIRAANERLEEDAPPIIHRLDKTDAEERAKFEKEARSRELQEIAALRKPKWEEVVSGAQNGQNRGGLTTDGPDKANIRGAASAWQEREKQSERSAKQPPAPPTRRIGNLFSHNSSQWRMEDPDEDEDEPFPAPPSQDEVNNNALFEEYLNDCYSSEQEQQLGHRSGTPAPPPRDSSKDYMMEFQHTSVEQSWESNNN